MTAVLSEASAMPFRELEFRASRQGGETRCRILYHGRAMAGLVGALRTTPAHIAGNVAAIHNVRRGRPADIVWPTTLASAWVLGESRPALVRVGAAAFRAAPSFPALLEFRRGCCALAIRDGDDETYLVAAGSPAAALALDEAVAAALPEKIRASVGRGAAQMRLAFVESLVGDTPSPGAAAALAAMRSGCGECVSGRGEFGDCAVWSFADRVQGRFSVVGFSAAGATLTIQFPFIGADVRLRAEWHDDALDYYVRDGLEIRPSLVTAATKAVVKLSRCGGFMTLLDKV